MRGLRQLDVQVCQETFQIIMDYVGQKNLSNRIALLDGNFDKFQSASTPKRTIRERLTGHLTVPRLDRLSVTNDLWMTSKMGLSRKFESAFISSVNVKNRRTMKYVTYATPTVCSELTVFRRFNERRTHPVSILEALSSPHPLY